MGDRAPKAAPRCGIAVRGLVAGRLVLCGVLLGAVLEVVLCGVLLGAVLEVALPLLLVLCSALDIVGSHPSLIEESKFPICSQAGWKSMFEFASGGFTTVAAQTLILARSDSPGIDMSFIN